MQGSKRDAFGARLAMTREWGGRTCIAMTRVRVRVRCDGHSTSASGRKGKDVKSVSVPARGTQAGRARAWLHILFICSLGLVEAVRYASSASAVWCAQPACSQLLLHLLLVVVVIVALERLLCQPLGLLADLLGHLFVSALGRPVEIADPRHLELEFLVLVVIVCDVDDARSLLDALL